MTKNQALEPKKIKGIDLSAIAKARKYEVEFYNIDSKIDSEKVKQLRNQLNMSQTFFAEVLGVSKKTIEKWEQGKNPIKGTSSRLLYLIEKNHNILDFLYCEKRTTSETDLQHIDDFEVWTKPVTMKSDENNAKQNHKILHTSQFA